MNVKQELYKKCKTILNQRLELINSVNEGLKNALQSETKSTAGDKHETGRAMLQLEREKSGKQLAEIQKQVQIITKINPEQEHTNAALGSVVVTTNATYFISVSLGCMQIDSNDYYCISAATPMAKALLAKKVGDEVSFREQKFTITSVV